MKLATMLSNLMQPWQDEDIDLYATHLRALLKAHGVEAADPIGDTVVGPEFTQVLRTAGYETPA